MREDPVGGKRENDPWRAFRVWFWCAALYNALWGTVVGFCPSLLLKAYGLTEAQASASGLPAILASCIGMFVAVYAIGYACVAIDPMRFWPFAAIGLAGKVLGPAGWVFEHLESHLAWSSIWVNVTNDLIWWPAFLLLIAKACRVEIRNRQVAELAFPNGNKRRPDES